MGRRENLRWYNAWQKRWRPYRQCTKGDEAFVLTPTHYSARGEFVFVEKFYYLNENEFFNGLESSGWGVPSMKHPYFEGIPQQGYCLAFWLDFRRLRKEKVRPEGYRLPQLGWAALNDAPRWLGDWLRKDAETF